MNRFTDKVNVSRQGDEADAHHRWVAAAQVPYFVWVSIATVLQLSITWMNLG